jgi:hypothetical protein
VITRRATEDQDLVLLTFAVPLELHDEVFVVGDFNEWEAPGIPLTPDGDGLKYATIVVRSPGRYAFRYRAGDGRWFNDESADDYEPNEFGGCNGIVST